MLRDLIGFLLEHEYQVVLLGWASALGALTYMGRIIASK